MAIPSSAPEWEERMDPADLIDYEADFKGVNPMLQADEEIASFTVALMPDASLLGVLIDDGSVVAERAPSLTTGNTRVKVWFKAEVANQADAVWDSEVPVGVVFTITTNSFPARIRQRTYRLVVTQR